MIRIKFIYSEDECKSYRLHEYKEEDLRILITGRDGKGFKEAPFRDTESVRLIREVANADVVEDDWFGVVSRVSGQRTCITGLERNVQYALIAIANSKAGTYTSLNYRTYEDILGRVGEQNEMPLIWQFLADMPYDALLYVKTWEFHIWNSQFYIPESLEGKVAIENYRYKGVPSSGMLSRKVKKDMLAEDGSLLIAGNFRRFWFEWYRDFGALIQEAERLLKYSFRWYRRIPKVSSVDEFATLDEEWQDDFYVLDEHKRRVLYPSFLEKIQVHNYLYRVPDGTYEKYPICLVLEEDISTGVVSVKRGNYGKYPEYSEIMISAARPDKDGRNISRLIVVIDKAEFFHREAEMKNAVWAFRYYDNILELYDGDDVLVEFVKFAKAPYEDGRMLMLPEDWECADE